MKKISIPDWFSLYRILIVPVIVLALVLEWKIVFIWLIMISLLTDWIDGFLARKLNNRSEQGAKLDSIGDIATLILMVAGLFRFQMPFLQEQKILLLIVSGLYVLQIALALMKYHKPTSFHTYSSKTSFALFGIFYAVLFFHGYISTLFLITWTFLFISVLEDLVLTFYFPEPKENIKGVVWIILKEG